MAVGTTFAAPLPLSLPIRPTRGADRLVIVGLTNSGKSALFNAIARTYSMVANYPQTTVEPNRKRVLLNGRGVEIVDTPGISSLVAVTRDEESTLEVLLGEAPGRVLFCGDALRLKQSLILLAQVRELGIPTVFCLNKADEAARRGLVIDTDTLSRELGSRVIETDAAHGHGLRGLLQYLDAPQPVGGLLRYPDHLERSLADIGGLFAVESRPSKGQILRMLMTREEECRLLNQSAEGDRLARVREAIRQVHWRQPPTVLQMMVFNAREEWANHLCRQVVHRSLISVGAVSRNLAWASRHPVWGWPIFFAIVWLTFHGVGVLSPGMAGLLDGWIFQPLVRVVDGWVAQPFLKDFLVGNFGLLTMGLFNAMVTVVPILVVFFLIMNVLEDTGYLPNLSVLANRSLAPFGLTGKAVLPLVLGTGCNTMATLTSRILESRKERLMAIFLIALGMPCAVQLGVMMAILASLPFSAFAIVWGAVAGSQIVCGVALNRLIGSRQGKGSEFILELPPFRWPDGWNVIRKTYHRVKWFLVEAVPMFMAAAVLMFFLERTGLLVKIKEFLHPVVTGFLSLPDQVTEVFILVLSRREVGAVYFKGLVDGGGLTFQQTVVGLVVMTLFIPCVSNTMMMIKEVGLGWAVGMNAAIIALAVLVGGLVNLLM
ncbi:MAG: ferrous iron transport protein B [Magnetococcales bacterium]|nr:ferrous iron transport protein B [Magnetococcales bacterium]